MNTTNASKRQFLKTGLAIGGAAAGLSGNLAFAQDKPLVTLRMSSTLPLDANSAHYVWYSRFAQNLKTAVGNKIVVNYFPSDQLGKESDVVNQVRIGSVDMMISGSSIWSTTVPEIGVLDMGYLFANLDHSGRALDGKAGAILSKLMYDRVGVQVLGWAYSLGARNVFTKNPVRSVAELKGIKLRVLPVRITEFSITEEAFDANLNPIRAKISLGLRVLSVNDVGFAHKAGNLFMAYLQAKEQLAQRNPGGALSTLGISGIP